MSRLRKYYMVQEERPWSELCSDIVGLVLAKLPEASVIRAGSVCKRWHSVTQLPCFIDYYKQCNFSFNKRSVIPVGDAKFSFIERSDGGFEFQSMDDCAAAQAVLYSEIGGDLIAVSRSPGGLYHATTTALGRTVIRYKICLLEKHWNVTTEMPYAVEDPIVGALGVENKATGDETFHKMIFAGGLPLDLMRDDHDDLAVSVYDEQSDSWDSYDPLPFEFRGCSCSVFMSSVVHKGKFYAFDMYSGLVSSLNLDSKRWSAVGVLLPSGGVNKVLLVSGSQSLYVVTVQEESPHRDLLFRVWNVVEEENGTMRVGKLLQSCTFSKNGPAPPPFLSRWTSLSLEGLVKILGIALIIIVKLVLFFEAVVKKAMNLGLVRSKTVE